MDTCFADRIQTALNQFSIYSVLKDIINGENPLAGLEGKTDTDRFRVWLEWGGETEPLVRSLLYLQGSFIYPLLWDKPPTKTALKAAVDFIYKQ